MNPRLLNSVLILGLWTAFSASAAELANSGFMLDLSEPVARPVSVPVPPPPRTDTAIGPVVNDQGNVAPAKPAAPSGTGRGCIPSRPYKESTPLKFHVDQINQTMTVTSPDFPPGQSLTFKVSTGGATLTRAGDLSTSAKIPHPDSKVAPYCPQTNAISKEPKLVTSFQQDEFSGRRDCSEDDVRGRSTVFPGNSYRSKQFDVVMPNALRFRGGQFFHRCPSAEACKALGQPISGECVRVPGWQKPPDWMMQAIREKRMDTSAIAFKNNRYRRDDGSTYTVPQIEISETLVKQALKYGAYEVTLSDPPPMRQRGEPASAYPYPTRLYCDEKDIEVAKAIQAKRIEPDGGWEAPDFGRAISDFFGGLFGGGQQQRQRVEPSRPETPEEKRQRLHRERQEQREREQWQRKLWENT